MKLQLTEPRHIFSVDTSTIEDPLQHKALLAMRATARNGEADFEEHNAALLGAAATISAAPTMTYEDLIFRNPFHDGAFVMSDNKEGAEQEALFYIAHADIESRLTGSIEALEAGSPQVAVAGLRDAVRQFGLFYRSLNREAFACFRSYFVGINGHPGPSGLFSVSIPTIDLLVHGGTNIAPDEKVRIKTHLQQGLYPSHQTARLNELLNSPPNSEPADDYNSLEIVRLLNNFRHVHHRTVSRFAGDVMNGEAEGSAGTENVAEYLQSKVLQTGAGHD